MNHIYKNFLKKIKRKNNYIFFLKKNDAYNGKKNLEIIITATKMFCKKNVYAEIGVFRGHTLINNAINNKNIKCYGIDNFSLFNKDGSNKEIVKNKIKKYKLKNVKLIDKDFEIAFNNIKRKIGVLFVDGAHDYRSQLTSLLKYKKLLAKKCLIIIDDANYFHVRKANQDFMDVNDDFSLLFQKYTDKHIANSLNKQKYINGYWNGINILSRCKTRKKIKFQRNHNFLMRMFPVSHEIFRHKYLFNSIEILDLVYFYLNGRIKQNSFLNKIKKLKIPKLLRKQIKYRSQNIF